MHISMYKYIIDSYHLPPPLYVTFVHLFLKFSKVNLIKMQASYTNAIYSHKISARRITKTKTNTTCSVCSWGYKKTEINLRSSVDLPARASSSIFAKAKAWTEYY